jgi:hypothetical protein
MGTSCLPSPKVVNRQDSCKIAARDVLCTIDLKASSGCCDPISGSRDSSSDLQGSLDPASAPFPFRYNAHFGVHRFTDMVASYTLMLVFAQTAYSAAKSRADETMEAPCYQ